MSVPPSASEGAVLPDVPRGVGPALAILGSLYVALVLLHPTHFLFDDSYTYLVIARRVLAGEGSTFDGLSPTNGYQPLWQALCLPAVALAELLGTPPVSTVLAFQAGLGVGMVWWFRRMAGRADLPRPTLALSFLMVYFLAGGVWGTEGWLGGLLQIAALTFLLAAMEAPQRPRAWIQAGIGLGLTVLARLDLVFLAAVACLVALLAGDRPLRERARAVLWMGAALAAVLTPYLLTNLLSTGHLAPVSVALKSSFPWPSPGGFLDKWGSFGGASVLAGGVALGLALAGQVGPALRRLLAVLGGSTLAHATFIAVFARPGWSTDHDNYYLTGALTLACLAGLLAQRAMRGLPSFDRAGRNRLTAALAMLLLGTGLLRAGARAFRVGAGGIRPRPAPTAVQLGRWMEANLPSGARIYTVDSPGRLAWYSRRSVLAADGLTADRSTGTTLAEQGLPAWLAGSRVTHVVTILADYETPWADNRLVGPDRVRLAAVNPWTGRPAGSVELPVEAALWVLGSEQSGGAPVGIWSWPPP